MERNINQHALAGVMYEFYVVNNRAEKNLHEFIEKRNDVKDKLNRLKSDPRREAGAHPLHGRLKGKWACWLGSDIKNGLFDR